MTKQSFTIAIMFVMGAGIAAGQTAAANPRPTQAPAAVRWQERRDPFVSPLREPANPTQGCSTNTKRCLSADEIVLKGIVMTKERGNMALVENSEHWSTLLYANDQIFHGTVVRITNDSLVIREITKDELNKTTTREVVKRVTPPPV